MTDTNGAFIDSIREDFTSSGILEAAEWIDAMAKNPGCSIEHGNQVVFRLCSECEPGLAWASVEAIWNWRRIESFEIHRACVSMVVRLMQDYVAELMDKAAPAQKITA